MNAQGRRVLISGGGIGGLTLAYWLARGGYLPTVIERANELRTGGYAIDFTGTGFDVAERMNILPDLERTQVPVEEVIYVDESGNRVAAFGIERMKRMLGSRYMALMHQTLERVLFDAVRNDAEVRFGTSLAYVAQDAGGVHVTFENGAQETYDLLVGADGIHSRVRELVAGPESDFLQFMGYAIASYRVRDTFGLGANWSMNVQPGRMVGLYASNEPGYAYAFFMWKCADAEHVSRERRLTQLHQTFDGMSWIVPQVLSAAEASADIFMDVVGQIHMPSWHSGRVALIGDACACPTLASGQGASLAMGGGYHLAQALRESAGYQAAFSTYEGRVRPYVEAQQRGARSFMKQFIPDTALGVALQRAVMKVIFRDPFIGLLRRQFNVRSIVQPA